MCQRRLDPFNLVDHDIFDFADGMRLHFSEGCMEKTICKFQAQTFQYMIGYLMGCCGRACIA